MFFSVYMFSRCKRNCLNKVSKNSMLILKAEWIEKVIQTKVYTWTIYVYNRTTSTFEDTDTLSRFNTNLAQSGKFILFLYISRKLLYISFIS